MPQPTLRITETAESTPGKYHIEVRLEGAGRSLSATVPLAFELSPQDREDLRWYLEDFLQFPLPPAPELAARIEARMAEIGDALCKAIFSADGDAARIWDRVRDMLSDTRVEVVTDVRHAASVPWELIRDPLTKVPLALEAQAFVRGLRMPTKVPRDALETSGGPIRILLVICRPRAGKDVPFRSVAKKLFEGLDEASREFVSLDVLRPPTFDMLSRVLRDAKRGGKPYHVVHFDGHGAYVDDPEKNAAAVLDGLNAHVFGDKRRGARGYLVFEASEEAAKERGQLVDGHELGKLLVETGVPVLVLNACRSAHADPPPEPKKTGEGETVDAHGDIETFGSLALEIMDKGVSGVVAMRYNVYVATAAQFVADLYASLANGLALGEAVTRGRKQLHDQPLRTIAYDPLKLQDWCVPVVYEAQPLPLFSVPVSSRGIELALGSKGRGEGNAALIGLPAEPDVGFLGRDETLLALDRAFDKHQVVLLHAYAGSGKSSTAAEFGRWYARTGGVKGAILWTSFERRIPLPQVLDLLARVFDGELKRSGIEWLALSDVERREIALKLLAQIPVLWIWDNVEPIAGFPAETVSAWSAEEQRELVDFLREARGTKAKFLLTSRRDERAWLGELPARIEIPPMPMLERVQFARELAGKRGVKLEEVDDWRPLLAFTQGNPLTIMVLVGQALRDRLQTKEQLAAFVEKLRAGESAFEDEASEGRSRSLGASLGYGFEFAFGEEERKRLALLHLFQGFVDVDALRIMGDPDAPWCLPEVRGLTREAGIALLDRAAEIGLLDGRGEGYYSIHPAVPWFFHRMFASFYPEVRGLGEGSDATSAMRAYVETTGFLGNLYTARHGEGYRDVLKPMEFEEANFLRTIVLARENKWLNAVVGAMQALSILYRHVGRQAEWARLVAEVEHEFIDPQTGGPIPGHDDDWGIISDYRVKLSREAHEWQKALELQQRRVQWSRKRAEAALAVPPGLRDAILNALIRSLGVALYDFAQIQRETNNADCIRTYGDAADVFMAVGSRIEQAAIQFELGNYCSERGEDERAARCYAHSLEMYDQEHAHGRAKCLNALGLLAVRRHPLASIAEQFGTHDSEHLATAFECFELALGLLPLDAVEDLANVHDGLGRVFMLRGEIKDAIFHFHESIRYEEQRGYLYGAAQTRVAAAVALVRAGRLTDARSYAVAALRNYGTYGDRAADRIKQTQEFLTEIDLLLHSPQPR